MHRIALLAALMLPMPASAQPSEQGFEMGPADIYRDCPADRLVSARPGKGAFKRLDELPPADHILTVLRTENGCPTLVVLREGIGETE